MRLFRISAGILAGGMLALGAHLSLASGTAVKPSPKPSPKAAAAPRCALLKLRTPNTLGGLKVTYANPCSTFLEARGSRALDGIALITLRQPDDLLMATLEVGRFQSSAPISDASFRSGVIGSIGDVDPRPLQVGGETVYASASPGLTLVTWIRGRYLYVLAIRSNYAFPKALLRDALKVQG